MNWDEYVEKVRRLDWDEYVEKFYAWIWMNKINKYGRIVFTQRKQKPFPR